MRIKALDGWRGIAILLVVIDHIDTFSEHPHKFLAYLGQHGVALFFVLSGYLITSRLIAERERTGTIDFRSFYVRRIFRLWPAAWLYLLAITLAYRNPAFDVLRCIGFIRNYADGSVWTLHFWSLSIEEQFYLFWPVILLWKRARSVALILAVAIAGWRMVHYGHLDWVHSTQTQYRADALFVGCIAAMTPIKPKLTWFALPIVAVCVCCFHMLIPLVESVAFALLIQSRSRLLENPVLVWLGTISYSLYLWQEFWLGTFRQSTWAAMTCKAGLMIASASLSYYLVERPALTLLRQRLACDCSCECPACD